MDDIETGLSAGLPTDLPLDAGAAPLIQSLTDQVEAPAVIIPKPFSLENCDPEDIKKLNEEVLDKSHTSEDSMSEVYGEHEEYVDSWRIKPGRVNAGKPKGFSNDKSGETHRASETLATSWVRMLTADDPFIQGIAEGLDENGLAISEEMIYANESLLMKQMEEFTVKPTLYKGFTSTGLFGSAIFENFWKQLFNLDGSVYMEGTELRLRSLLLTFFDTSCEDFGDSEFMATIDFPSIWRLKSWAASDPETWNQAMLNDLDPKKYQIDGGGRSQAYSRLTNRRQRAGYSQLSSHIRELFTYHGRLDPSNRIIQQYCESIGMQNDPSQFDFTYALLDEKTPAKFHVTQYGDWRTKFQWAHYKPFELEPLAYGVGRLGRVKQRELDLIGSRANDILFFALNNMWMVDRYANVKQEQLMINPNNVIEVDGNPSEKISALRPDIQAIIQAMSMSGVSREELRSNTGAASQLQAILTKATATENSIAQSEAVRALGVHAEMIAETFLRRYVRQCHINNHHLLNNDIWLYITGLKKPRMMNKQQIPLNIGYKIKCTTDKNFRPERLQKIIEGLQMGMHVNNALPESLNVVRPLFEEYFRSLGMNPGLLNQPIPIRDQISTAMQRQTRNGGAQAGAAGQDVSAYGATGSVDQISAPTPTIPTSPIQGV